MKTEYYDNINNIEDLKALMQGFQDAQVRTVSIVFGRAYLDTWTVPSKINPNAYGDSPLSYKGYWKQGRLYPFSDKLIIKYQQKDNTR